MRKIKLFIASSLDGFIAREDGSIDWLPQSGNSGYEEFFKTIDTVIIGRKTYEQILTFGKYPYEGKKSYVLTKNTTIKKEGNVEFVFEAEKLVKELISSSGKDIWLVGGAELVSVFLNQDLIDEIILSIIPVVLGKGIPLFKNIRRETKLQLLKTREYDELVELNYKVKKLK